MIRDLEIVTAAEATPEMPRCSEGAMVELSSGELFMVFQRYERSEKGSEDDAPNKLVSLRSRDGGRTWGDPRVEVVPEPGDINVYSPNLIRRQDGAIVFVYKRYVQLGAGLPTLNTAVVCVSHDECASFTGHRVLWERQSYGFCSDSIRQLADGRLVLPLCKTISGAWGKGDVYGMGCGFSDDGGESWRIGTDWVCLPMRGAMEGHVEELRDGRLMMVMRTQLGAVFKAYSSDKGESWSKAQTTGLRAPESCPELMRTPDGGLMVIWNNSEYDPGFRSHYGKRTPLSVALSDDEGETFRHVGDLETDPRWAYSNPGACFLADGTCLLNYWAVQYTPNWVMSGLIHLKVARFRLA